MKLKLKENDYVCFRRGKWLEFGIYLGPLAIPLIAFNRKGFDHYWPSRFPRSPLYLVKFVQGVPVPVRRISYKGCP